MNKEHSEMSPLMKGVQAGLMKSLTGETMTPAIITELTNDALNREIMRLEGWFYGHPVGTPFKGWHRNEGVGVSNHRDEIFPFATSLDASVKVCEARGWKWGCCRTSRYFSEGVSVKEYSCYVGTIERAIRSTPTEESARREPLSLAARALAECLCAALRAEKETSDDMPKD